MIDVVISRPELCAANKTEEKSPPRVCPAKYSISVSGATDRAIASESTHGRNSFHLVRIFLFFLSNSPVPKIPKTAFDTACLCARGSTPWWPERFYYEVQNSLRVFC